VGEGWGGGGRRCTCRTPIGKGWRVGGGGGLSIVTEISVDLSIRKAGGKYVWYVLLPYWIDHDVEQSDISFKFARGDFYYL
jgi:hypothetical protein